MKKNNSVVQTIVLAVLFSGMQSCLASVGDVIGTWTALDDLAVTSQTKFNETWTQLNEIQSMIDSIDEPLSLTETWTVLSGVLAVVCSKFDQTWTVIDDINQLVATAVANQGSIGLSEIFTSLDELEQVLCDKLDDTSTMLGCTEISVLPTMITQSGVYFLETDKAGQLFISASDVVVDLNGRTLSNSGGSINGIIVSGGVNNIKIFNGTVSGFDDGITVASAVENVVIENVIIRDSSSYAIDSDGDNIVVDGCAVMGGFGIRLTGDNCSIAHTVCSGVSGGLTLTGCENCLLQDVKVCNSNAAGTDDFFGFSLSGCTYCILRECSVAGIVVNDGDFIGFQVSNATRYSAFFDCFVADVVLTNVSALSEVVGFHLLLTAEWNVFERCVVNGMHTLNSVGASRMNGFRLQTATFDDIVGNIFIDCKAVDITSDNAGNLRGFGFFGSVGLGSDNVFMRCVAERVRGISGVAGFIVGSVGRTRNVFFDCLSHGHESSGGGGFDISSGFQDDIGSAFSSSNVYPKCIAFDCDIPFNFVSTVAAPATWIEPNGALGTPLPSAAQPFSGLGVVA